MSENHNYYLDYQWNQDRKGKIIKPVFHVSLWSLIKC